MAPVPNTPSGAFNWPFIWEAGALTGTIHLNDPSNKIDLATINSSQAMVEATRSKIGNQPLTKVNVWYLSGS